MIYKIGRQKNKSSNQNINFESIYIEFKTRENLLLHFISSYSIHFFDVLSNIPIEFGHVFIPRCIF